MSEYLTQGPVLLFIGMMAVFGIGLIYCTIMEQFGED